MVATGNPAFIFMNAQVRLSLTAITSTSPDFVCQVTRAELTNNVNMVDTGSLCGAAQQPGKIEWTLELEGYQGYDTTDLWRFLWDNERKQAFFEIVPKDEVVSITNPSVTGTIVCVPGTLGGTREEVAAFSVSLPLVGVPALSSTAPVMAEASSSSSSSSPSTP